MTVSPTSLGFGSVVAGVTSAAKTVTLTNPNPEAITFASITPSGDYAMSNGCPTVLGPSTSCTVSVTFTPTAKGSRPAPLDILSDATSSPQKVNLNGTGTLPLNTTGSLGFGSVVAGVTSAAKTITLSNSSPTLPITLSSITTSGDFAATDDCGGVVAPSGSCTISVTFTPTATGSRTGKVTVQSDATNNPRTVNLSGTGTLPLTVSGGPVSFRQPGGGHDQRAEDGHADERQPAAGDTVDEHRNDGGLRPDQQLRHVDPGRRQLHRDPDVHADGDREPHRPAHRHLGSHHEPESGEPVGAGDLRQQGSACLGRPPLRRGFCWQSRRQHDRDELGLPAGARLLEDVAELGPDGVGRDAEPGTDRPQVLAGGQGYG